MLFAILAIEGAWLTAPVNGAQTTAIDSGDTDVLSIPLGFYHQLKSKFSFIDIILDFSMDVLSQTVGETRCQALPFFHALTG